MARQSYFAEKRGQNNDPNFFSRIPLDEIRKNVRRIIKDIRYDLIIEQDYNYFHSQQILQACIAEAQENYTSSVVVCNSLNFYINECLNRGVKPFPSSNLMEERMYASKEQIVQNARSKNWYNILQMFIAISYGADIRTTLMPIQMIDSKEISNL
jgi:hypothetical protein